MTKILTSTTHLTNYLSSLFLTHSVLVVRKERALNYLFLRVFERLNEVRMLICVFKESNENKTIQRILVHTHKFGMCEIKTRITYCYEQNY